MSVNKGVPQTNLPEFGAEENKPQRPLTKKEEIEIRFMKFMMGKSPEDVEALWLYAKTQHTPYPQNWPAYNAAQSEEKLLFLDILAELCSTIQDKRQHSGAGRPWKPMDEMVFAAVSKVYEGLSSRRVSSDLEISKNRGYLSFLPSFNTVLNYLKNEDLTPILYALIELSSMPLRGFEEVFAVDASGLSSAFYSRWLDYRFNGETRYRDWLKIHIAVGTKSQIVTAIKVTDGHSSDSPQFPALLKKTAEHFQVKAVCADKGYSSRENFQTAWDIGALPLIPFKSNTSTRKLGQGAWRKMYFAYQADPERFMKLYHQRSIVESSFSALKRKFQGKLLHKSETGRVNEALAKVLCYNICVLIHEAKKNGVELSFKSADAPAQQLPDLHNNPTENKTE